MDQNLFLSNIEKDRRWYTNNIIPVSISNLTVDDEKGSQVRTGGLVPAHIEKLMDSISHRGVKIPITIDEDFDVVDGCHRVACVRSLHENDPEDKRWWEISAYQRSFSTDEERRQYQIDRNDHLPARSSTNDDIAASVKEDIQAGVYPEFTWQNFNSSSENTDILLEKIKKKFGKKERDAKSICKKALSDTPNQPLKNYHKKMVEKNFSKNNPIGWSGKKSGDESNGFSVYVVAKECNISPNLNGLTFGKKTRTPNTKTVCVFYDSETFGKDGARLDKSRCGIVDKINKQNNSWLLNKSAGATLVDEIFITPQKIRTNKENSDVFFKVKKNPDGTFDSKSIPKSGWK